MNTPHPTAPLLDEAERQVEQGDARAALNVLDRAYREVQPPRDLEGISRALTLLARIANTTTGREQRRAKKLTDHFSVLERSYRAHHGEAPAGLSAPPATAPGFVGTHAASAYPTWTNGLVSPLWVFLALELAGGLIVAAASKNSTWRRRPSSAQCWG